MSVVAFCSMNKVEKSTKKSKFFWSSDFKTSNNNDDEKTSKRCCSTSFEFFFAEKICSLWVFSFALRFEIAILFDKIICKKSKLIATKAIFFWWHFQHEFFWIVLSTKTLKKEISRSKVIEKIITKCEKKIETMNKRHLQKFEIKNKKIKK